MVIVTAADDRFALPLGVMVHSLLTNARPDADITLYVLSDGISRRHRRRLEAVVAPAEEERCVDLHWVETGADGLLASASEDSPPLRTTPFISQATYLRLLVPELVADTHDRALYLDADLLVERDLTPLWEAPFDDNDLLAVRDYKIQTVDHPKGLRLYGDLGLPPDHPYFNAGVLVLNLKTWRERAISSQVFDYLNTHHEAVNENDQDGLNAVLARRWRPLDPRWNRQTALHSLHRWPDTSFKNDVSALLPEIQHAPFIDHFTEGDKPWDVNSAHPSRARFLRYLAASGWFTPLEFRAWRALQIAKIPERHLREYTRPLRNRLKTLMPS